MFDETELADLTFAVIANNGWSRLNVVLESPAGSYRVGVFEQQRVARPTPEFARTLRR